MQLGQEAHQIAAASRVSILQSLYVSLVAGCVSPLLGVCHSWLVCTASSLALLLQLLAVTAPDSLQEPHPWT